MTPETMKEAIQEAEHFLVRAKAPDRPRKVFVHRYRDSHEKRRAAIRRAKKNGIAIVLKTERDGWLYARPVPAPAVAVPEEWRNAVREFLESHDAAWAELISRLPTGITSVSVSTHQADSVKRANVLRALLQSTGDKK